MISDEALTTDELLLSDETAALETTDEITQAEPILADPVSNEDEILPSETTTVYDNEELSEDSSIVSGSLPPEGTGNVENVIELNQAFSMHTGLKDPTVTYINTFVADKSIAVTMLIPGADTQDKAIKAKAGYSLEFRRITNGVEADGAEYYAKGGDYFAVRPVYEFRWQGTEEDPVQVCTVRLRTII